MAGTKPPQMRTAKSATQTRGRSTTPRARVGVRVSDIMTRTVVTAHADTPLPELIDKMLHYGVSGIPVVDSNSRLVGIVTEADLISKPAYGGRRRRALAVIGDLLRGREQRWLAKAKGVTAGQIMSTSVATAAPNDAVQVTARLMIEAGVKRLPVVDEERLVGIISRADVLGAMHRSDEELQAEIIGALRDPLRAPENALVEATVADGVVTLRGTVPFPIDVPVLSAIVWQFPGVVDVHNELTPEEPNPAPPPTRMSDYEYLRSFR
jgi:CBS domain-containing protein